MKKEINSVLVSRIYNTESGRTIVEDTYYRIHCKKILFTKVNVWTSDKGILLKEHNESSKSVDIYNKIVY